MFREFNEREFKNGFGCFFSYWLRAGLRDKRFRWGEVHTFFLFYLVVLSGVVNGRFWLLGFNYIFYYLELRAGLRDGV